MVGFGAVAVLQGLADPQMKLRAARLGDARVHRLAKQRVGEGVAVQRPRHVRQQAGLESRLQRSDHILPGTAADLDQQLGLELAPDHRCHLEHVGSRRSEASGAVGDRLAHELGHPLRVERLPQRSRLSRRSPFADRRHVIDERLDEERVAVRLLVDRLGQARFGVAAADRRDQLHHLGDAETAEVHALEEAFAPEVCEDGREVVAGLGLAVGRDEHQLRRVRRAREVAEDQQRAWIRPVQVVEYQQRRLRRRDRRQGGGDRVEQPLAGHFVGHLGRLGQAQHDLRHERRQDSWHWPPARPRPMRHRRSSPNGEAPRRRAGRPPFPPRRRGRRGRRLRPGGPAVRTRSPVWSCRRPGRRRRRRSGGCPPGPPARARPAAPARRRGR